MPSQELRTRQMISADRSAVIELTLAQETRQAKLDVRLPLPRSRQQITAALDRAESSSFVIENTSGSIRGYMQPTFWNLSPENEMRTFFTARNGSLAALVLPTPTEDDAQDVLKAALHQLNTYWSQQQTTGDLVRWPSADRWIEEKLYAEDFLLDSVMAVRPVEPLSPSRYPPAPNLKARLARPEDEDAIVALYMEEMRVHEEYTPFTHITPFTESTFRAKLVQTWRGESPQDGAPLMVVVEQAEKVVGMAENELDIYPHTGGSANFLPPTRAGYINNVAVSKDSRRQGVGQVLLRGVMDAFAPYHINTYTLWFSPANPLASSFWPRRGFEPLWHTYQRLHLSS